jgi:hypothetical protein
MRWTVSSRGASSYETMKMIALLLALLSVTPTFAALSLEMKTQEEREQWSAAAALIFQGDLSPVHAAYVRRDLKFLWNLYCLSLSGATLPPSDRGTIDRRLNVDVPSLNAIVRDYSGRLLSQIPGHAKYLGDEIDALAAQGGDGNLLRDNYLDRLAQLGSDECLHEIGRFWDDTRGRLPPEQEKATIEYFRGKPNDAGLQLPSPVNRVAHIAMWQAKYSYPWQKAGKKTQHPLLTARDDMKKVEDWWRSAESEKCRQPIDLTRQPPEEPAPQRLDLQTLYQLARATKAQAEKEQAEKEQAEKK